MTNIEAIEQRERLKRFEGLEREHSHIERTMTKLRSNSLFAETNILPILILKKFPLGDEISIENAISPKELSEFLLAHLHNRLMMVRSEMRDL